MPDLHHLTLFMLASLTLLLIPGPAILYIVTQSLQQGTKAGLVSTTGIALGGLVHVFATAFGLSAILVASTSAFLIIKWTGAAYLIYLGLRTWLGPKKTESPEEKPTAPLALKKAFWRGVWVQVLNPKSAIFFMAFLPQFTQPERGPVFGQLLFLGLLFEVTGFITDSSYALLSGRVGGMLKQAPRFMNLQRRLCGSIYIGLGLTAALGGPSKQS